ncbi:unnamed protein product, partial [Thlaspi arvense]
GSRIHATVEEDLIYNHRNVFSINAFMLKEYFREYRTSTLPMKLIFLSKPKPAVGFPPELPEQYFADFSEILDGKHNKNILIDVIGQILNVGSKENVQMRGKKVSNTKLELILRDAK